MKKILGCIRKADKDYKMIQANDKIAVGVSGGKDSMLLLYAMSLYKRFCDVPFEVVGIHIQLGFPNMDFTEAAAFFQEQDIAFYSYPSEVYDILKRNLNANGTIKCSLCSKFKKATVIDAAKKLGCNKISFGHHADDAIETLMMNAIHGGRLATFKPIMYMDKTDITFLRPLIYAFESDVEHAVKTRCIPIVPSTCPNDGYTERQRMKDMFLALCEEFPMAKENFLLMLHNQEQVALWHKESE